MVARAGLSGEQTPLSMVALVSSRPHLYCEAAHVANNFPDWQRQSFITIYFILINL
jgi:hypothetical protein